MELGRFQFFPFWHLTKWGFLFNNDPCSAFKLNYGCDEWHNKSRFFIIPLVGEFVWFKTMNRDGPVHLFSTGPHGGHYDLNCDICQEINKDFAWERENAP